MKFIKTLLLVLLLSFSLVLGVTTITSDKLSYSFTSGISEKITFTGTCSVSPAVAGLQALLGNSSVWIDEVRSSTSNFNSELKVTASGNYTLLAACNGDNATRIFFCVGNCNCTPSCTNKVCGSNGCGSSCGSCPSGKICDSNGACITCTPNCTGKVCGSDGCGGTCGTCNNNTVCNTNGTSCVACTPNCTGKTCGDNGCGGSCGSCSSGQSCSSGNCVTPSSDGGNFPSKGGKDKSSCESSWDCGSWGYCNANLKQSRTCVDLKSCNPSKIEQRPCTKCDESWVCSAWSECVYGEQVRACQDEHKCGTVTLKPLLRKYCAATYVAGPEPVSVSPKVQTPVYYPASQPEPQPVSVSEQVKTALKPTQPATQFSLAKVWADYQVVFLGLGIVVVAMIIIILLVVHFAKPKQKVYNLDELKQWIVKERQMGTSDEQIRKILSQNTGWNEEEIAQSFNELNTGR